MRNKKSLYNKNKFPNYRPLWKNNWKLSNSAERKKLVIAYMQGLNGIPLSEQ